MKLDKKELISEIKLHSKRDSIIFDFNDEQLNSDLFDIEKDIIVLNLKNGIRAIESEYYLDLMEKELLNLNQFAKAVNLKGNVYVINTEQEFLNSSDRMLLKNPLYLKDKVVGYIKLTVDEQNKNKVECF